MQHAMVLETMVSCSRWPSSVAPHSQASSASGPMPAFTTSFALAEQSFDAAVKDFDRAIALDRTNPMPFADKGLALVQTSPRAAPQARAATMAYM